MSIWSLTYQQNVTIISHIFYLQDGGKKLTSIDVEQNYAIVALRIAKVAL